MLKTLGGFEWHIFFLLLSTTIITLIAFFHLLKDYRSKWIIFSTMASVFLYSGLGISFSGVSNRYAINYILFVVAFCIPFLLYNRKILPKQNFSLLDRYLISRYDLLKRITFIYIILLLIPLVYPEFKLFNAFTVRDDYWNTIAFHRSNTIVSTVDMLALMLRPFFFVFIVCYLQRNPKGKKHLFLFLIVILFSYTRLHYLGRNAWATYIVEFLLLAYCIKGFEVRIKKTHLAVVLIIVILSIPLLYAQTYWRHGESIELNNLSYSYVASSLFVSEFSYPQFYDTILNSESFSTYNPFDYIFYVLCIPIPSFIWPSKPSIGIADAFTYSMWGLQRGDTGFYISLPSTLGEAFMFFGQDFSWVFALFSGFIVATVIHYFCRHKTMVVYIFFLIIQSFTYGRGGTAGLMPMLLSGSIGVLIFDFYLRKTYKCT